MTFGICQGATNFAENQFCTNIFGSQKKNLGFFGKQRIVVGSCRKILKEKVWVWYFCLVLTKVIWFSSIYDNTKHQYWKFKCIVNNNQVPRIIQKFWEYYFIVVIFNNKMERTICKLVVKSRFETLKKPARTIHC